MSDIQPNPRRKFLKSLAALGGSTLLRNGAVAGGSGFLAACQALPPRVANELEKQYARTPFDPNKLSVVPSSGSLVIDSFGKEGPRFPDLFQLFEEGPRLLPTVVQGVDPNDTREIRTAYITPVIIRHNPRLKDETQSPPGKYYLIALERTVQTDQAVASTGLGRLSAQSADASVRSVQYVYAEFTGGIDDNGRLNIDPQQSQWVLRDLNNRQITDNFLLGKALPSYGYVRNNLITTGLAFQATDASWANIYPNPKDPNMLFSAVRSSTDRHVVYQYSQEDNGSDHFAVITRANTLNNQTTNRHFSVHGSVIANQRPDVNNVITFSGRATAFNQIEDVRLWDQYGKNIANRNLLDTYDRDPDALSGLNDAHRLCQFAWQNAIVYTSYPSITPTMQGDFGQRNGTTGENIWNMLGRETPSQSMHRLGKQILRAVGGTPEPK